MLMQDKRQVDVLHATRDGAAARGHAVAEASKGRLYALRERPCFRRTPVVLIFFGGRTVDTPWPVRRIVLVTERDPTGGWMHDLNPRLDS